jgi:hypothetical protein
MKTPSPLVTMVGGLAWLSGRMRHRMPQMAGVFFLDEIVVVLANI